MIERDLIRLQSVMLLQLRFGAAVDAAMLDKRRQDAPDVAAPQERSVLAVLTVDRDGRVFVGLSGQRLAVFDLCGFL